MFYEIVILAAIAAFLGLRLYSVLGQRADHEEHVPNRYDPAGDTTPPAAPVRQLPQALQPARDDRMEGAVPAVERGVRDIAAADRSFDLTAFLEGAQGAYGMVLEAYWQGDRETLRELCDDDVYAGFDAAIAAREQAGETLDNRLIRIEDATIHSATLEGSTARLAVLFVADIAAVTRDGDGNIVAGSLDDAIVSRDIWTFSRDVTSGSPHWILDETDEG
ncbi:Tim44/TimA family putative adaptor protein [Leptolyngbya sp. 15MV]|nr:Tim44/TimA family putative adaptor protein [Leptolyngbya sp. 15MV]